MAKKPTKSKGERVWPCLVALRKSDGQLLCGGIIGINGRTVADTRALMKMYAVMRFDAYTIRRATLILDDEKPKRRPR